MERMTEAVNAYYQFSWDAVKYVKTGGISTEQTAILAAGVLVSSLLVGGFLQKKGRILLAVLFAFGFLAPFLVGRAPENRTVWELLIGIMGLLAMQTALPGKQRKIKFFGTANGMLIGIAALAFVEVHSILEPLLTTKFSAGQSKTKLTIRRTVAGYRKKYQREWKDRYCSRRYWKWRLICGGSAGTRKRAPAESDSRGKTTDGSVFVWIYWSRLQ